MSWDFVGREGEVAALQAAWLAAGAGEVAPVVVVYGEAGIGKTRIASEFARVVRERGGEVLWGTCYEGGPARPYAVWAEALGGYAEGLGAVGLRAALGDDVRWLEPLLPESEPARLSAPARVARLRLAEVLARVLDSMERPPVVVLDDMQWAYPESLELFGHVARLAVGAVMVVCCRGGALDLAHPLAQRLAEIYRLRSCEYLSLDGLSRGEAGELLEGVTGGALESELVDTVYAESGGNAFFLGELGRHLNRAGAGASSTGAPRALPESIRGAVGLRLAGLSAQTRHVLQLASVFTGGFGFGELAALTELEDSELLDCLEQALDEELIRSLDGERYDFAHALVRHTLYERLSPSRRARLHRRLAGALEHLHAEEPTRVAAELVWQYHASMTLPGASRGAGHAMIAGRGMRVAGAPGDAVVLLRLGLDLVADGEVETRSLLLGELARAEAEAGLSSDALRTLEAALSSLERSDAAGEDVAELVNAVGVALWAAPTRSQAIEPLVKRALAAVGQTQSLAWARLRLLQRFAAPETFGPVHVVRRLYLDPDAVRIARGEGTEADYALTVDGWAPSFGDETRGLITRLEGWHDPVARLRAVGTVVEYLTMGGAGKAPETDRLCDTLEALADDVGLPPDRALARVYRASLLGGRGEFDAAAGQIERARGVLTRQPAPDVIAAVVALVEGVIFQHVAADWPRLASEMWELARNPERSGWLSLTFAAFAGQAFARAGEADQARKLLGHILAALEPVELLDARTSSPVGLAGAAVWELRAADLAARLLPRAAALGDADRRAGYLTSQDLTAARLNSLLGRFDPALEYFARARLKLEHREQPVLRAIVDYDEAVARLANKRPGAATLLSAASARFEQLGMREWSGRAALVKVRGDGFPDGLTAREAEILRFLALGKTNREIAGELVISVHTVERHVQNAYRKIEVRNRAEASSYVARVGLWHASDRPT